MANSKYAYVRSFEREEVALPSTFLLVRLDGKGFQKFSQRYAFDKPNDRRALDLMNEAARRVLESEAGQGMILAFGESDEFSFLYDRQCQLFGLEKCRSKILTTVLSTFTAFYVRLWPRFFPDTPLQEQDDAPSFDGRIVQYPRRQEVIDYMRWRQVDTHINNLYNTTFWSLIHTEQMSAGQAHSKLNGSSSSQKNEILFSKGINYNDSDPMFRKGSLWIRLIDETAGEAKSPHRKRKLELRHEDFIDQAWWERPEHKVLLSD